MVNNLKCRVRRFEAARSGKHTAGLRGRRSFPRLPSRRPLLFEVHRPGGRAFGSAKGYRSLPHPGQVCGAILRSDDDDFVCSRGCPHRAKANRSKSGRIWRS